MKKVLVLVLTLVLVLSLAACGSGDDEAERIEREKNKQAIQDAKDAVSAYESLKEVEDKFDKALKDYYNEKNN